MSADATKYPPCDRMLSITGNHSDICNIKITMLLHMTIYLKYLYQ